MSLMKKTLTPQQRILFLISILLGVPIVATPLLNAGVHFLVVGTPVLILGAIIGSRMSNKNGYTYLFILTALVSCYSTPLLINDFILSQKGSIALQKVKDVLNSDAAVIELNNVHMEKEKYGHYLHSYRGYRGYFVAPVVENDWTPKDTVYLFAAFEAESSYEKLQFDDPGPLPDSVSTTDTILSVPVDFKPQERSTIYFYEWNEPYNKGLRINDDIDRYLDAVKDAGIKHQLVVAANPVLIYWTENPERELSDQLTVDTIMTVSLIVVIFIWTLILEKKISEEGKQSSTA
jgi:hypothetical protein